MVPSGSLDADALKATVRFWASKVKSATGDLFTDSGLDFGANEARPTTTTTSRTVAVVATIASFFFGLMLPPPRIGCQPRSQYHINGFPWTEGFNLAFLWKRQSSDLLFQCRYAPSRTDSLGAIDAQVGPNGLPSPSTEWTTGIRRLMGNDCGHFFSHFLHCLHAEAFRWSLKNLS